MIPRSMSFVWSSMCAALLSGSVAAPGVVLAAGTGKPVVVELFTSQGCSSCPPADALLGELAARPGVIALAFHVDYWDGIGWRDRFEVPEATSRQRGYVATLRLSSAFTPQAIVDGEASFVGSDRRLATVVTQAPDILAIEVAVVGGELAIVLPASAAGRQYDINLVSYLPQARTDIARGENSGRHLVEYNIVRSFSRVGTWQGAAVSLHVPVASLPADASRVAVLVQEGAQGSIVGAGGAVLR